MMKTLSFWILVIFVDWNMNGQTYTMEVTYTTPSECEAGSTFEWELQGDGLSIDSYSVNAGGSGQLVYNNIPNYSGFTLSLNVLCAVFGGSTICPIFAGELFQITDRTAEQLITGETLLLSYCDGGVSATITRPNIDQLVRLGGAGNLCMGQQLQLGALPAGFPSVAYNWQYSFNNAIWLDFPAAFNHVENVALTMEELLGANHTNYLETTIYFRIGGYGKGAFSPTLPVFYSTCGPLLTSLTPVAPSCSYNDDGSFTAQFDRPLDVGQTLDVNLYLGAIGAGGVFLGDTGLPLDGANTLNWTETLAPGNYYFAYGITGLNFSDYTEFTITAPSAVTFDAFRTNINCFGENTGSIDITASGGAGNYQYELNGNGSWNNFASPNEHILTGLSPGDYQLRVRDANGCTEQN